jgi:hypothetical protein
VYDRWKDDEGCDRWGWSDDAYSYGGGRDCSTVDGKPLGPGRRVRNLDGCRNWSNNTGDLVCYDEEKEGS